MENCDTSRPIPITCDYCSKEYSSSTIVFHQKKHHADYPFSYTPNEISCSKCLQKILILNLHSHYTSCEKRVKKPILGTIIEEKADDSRILCKYCYRKFASDRIEKHQNACENSSKKRPRFEISRKRVPYLYDTYQKISSKRKSLNLIYPNSKWQKQHLELLKNLRYGEDESSCEDFVVCPYCLKKYFHSLIEKHIESCKTLLPKPKSVSMLKAKFPSIKKIETRLVLESSSTRWRPSSVLNRKENSEKNKIAVVSSFNNSDSGENNNANDLDLTPIKTPLLKKEFLDPNFKRTSKKEILTAVCPNCSKRFIASIADKHIINCRKFTLKVSATVQNLETKDQSLKGTLKVTKNNKALDKRSNSTQRLCEGALNCTNCGAVFPKSAKFCMMCGQMRFSG